MDILTGYDFSKKEARDRAEKHQADDKPVLLVGSPMCTMFSILQHMTPWSEDKQKRILEAEKHVQWACRMYEKQHDEGRVFLHEHPASASSWKLPCIRKLMKREGVYEVMYGLQAEDRKGKKL